MPGNKFHVTQGLLTPDAPFIISHLAEGLTALAKPAGELIMAWIDSLRKRGAKRNIIITDFANDLFTEFAEAVIGLTQ